ncbi:tRNA glutamyl-Q(34) synthetase GluQRS [Methylomonas sp. EFPC3]|uniref:tRNA glutamyl-Q(34) synthetase GluQRS n=1 Tax=Methylomonas sp. EFPC3 TaxID=3021710 RepID=UPI00325A710D
MHRLQDIGRNQGKAIRLEPAPPLSYIGRFAPSPTGPLHLGSLYTALASYLDARHQNGLWLLRIDDADTPRNMPGAAERILDCLAAFGLHWDKEADYQSRHLSQYQHALAELRQQDAVYPCSCSRSSLAAAGPIYPGHCRLRPQQTDHPAALRVKAMPVCVEFCDGLQGAIRENIAEQHGDFVVLRKDGIVAYQLAVVVDDQRQAITHIVRGCDLLESTPKQIYLQKLLGFPEPNYLHVPVIVDRAGQKLSKQTRAEAVTATSPRQTLFMLLSLLGQNPPPTLKQAEIPAILDWAVAHWSPEPLRGVRSVRLDSPPSNQT